MICSKCERENREGAKNCRACGTKFELACPECQAANALDSSIVMDAAPVSAFHQGLFPQRMPFDEKFAKIQKYLPTSVAEEILSHRDKIDEECNQ